MKPICFRGFSFWHPSFILLGCFLLFNGFLSANEGVDLTVHSGVMRLPSAPGKILDYSDAFGYSLVSVYPWWEWRIDGERRDVMVTAELSINSIATGRAGSLINLTSGRGRGAIGDHEGRSGTDTLRWFRGSSRFYSADRGHGTVEINRLDFSMNIGSGLDLIVGRMPVGLGTSRFVQVLDVIMPPETTLVDRDRRPGVDLIRVRTSIMDTGEGELLIGGKRPWDEGAALGRIRMVQASTDYEFLLGRFRGRDFLGVAWDHTINKASIWGEVAFTSSGEREFFRSSGDCARTRFTGIAGVERHLRPGSSVGAAIHFNNRGAVNASQLPAVWASRGYLDGTQPLAGRSHLVMTATREPRPLTNLSLSGILNLQDHSMLIQPVSTWSLDDETTLALYANIPLGKGPKTMTIPFPVPIAIPLPRSEFGSMPINAGFILKRSF